MKILDFDWDMISNYECSEINEIKSNIQKRYPNISFLILLESLTKDKQKIKYIRNIDNKEYTDYETWISVYPVYHNQYISLDNQQYVPSACCQLLNVHQNILILNDKCITQILSQLEEILEEINSSYIEYIPFSINNEFSLYAKYSLLL